MQNNIYLEEYLILKKKNKHLQAGIYREKHCYQIKAQNIALFELSEEQQIDIILDFRSLGLIRCNELFISNLKNYIVTLPNCFRNYGALFVDIRNNNKYIYNLFNQNKLFLGTASTQEIAQALQNVKYNTLED